MNKNKRQQIRAAILDEYKLGNNPHDSSLRIQKMFGLNFETRSSTIRMWFEQFYLGDESLENDPFREDLMPKKRETRKCKDTTSTTTNSTTSPDFNDTQTKLVFQLKEQVDLLYRKINAQDCCLKFVDRFFKKKLNNKANNNAISSSINLDQSNLLESFCKKYRFLRKKCRKLPSQKNFYEIVYDNLYLATDDNNNNNNNKKKNIVVRSKSKPTTTKISRNKSKSITSQVTVRNVLPQRKRGRPRSIQRPVTEKKKKRRSQKEKDLDQLPATCGDCGNVFKNRFRLKIHVKNIHERTERWKCSFESCPADYALKSDLRRHIRIVHTKDAKVHRCTWTDCSYTTHSSDMLRKHLNVHTGERPHKCVWPGCDKAFKSHSTLAFHKSIHKNERRYKCQWPGCGYACNVSSNLNKHTAIHERKKIQLNAVPQENSSTTTTNLT